MTPSSNFRPNPGRAVYVQGIIDQDLIDGLTPTIVNLKDASSEPITVYIDSVGGSTASADLLSQLLKSTNQDASSPPRIITVATGRAASAAADLLTQGDYALAYPFTVIHFHGSRYALDDPITLEAAATIAENLEFGNDQYALALAERCVPRFLFRFLDLRPQFDGLRVQQPEDHLDDLSCMRILLADRLSARACKILEEAFRRYGRYELLDSYVRSSLQSHRSTDVRLAETEAAILHAIIDFELKSNPEPAWNFEEIGLRLLRDDFLLLLGFLKRRHWQSLETLCDTWGSFFLTSSQQQELGNPETSRMRRLEALRPLLRPFWFFFVALCHVLQTGENELTAHDCYWLGLVDEIVGEPKLPSLRQLVEFAPA